MFSQLTRDWNALSKCTEVITQNDKKIEVATLKCIPALFSNVVVSALALSGLVAAFMIIFAGIKLITAQGDPKQIEGAQKTLTYAIIGLVIILLSFFIVSTIAYVTGANCIALPFNLFNCQAELR